MSEPADPRWLLLSSREREVLQQLAKGRTDRQIAVALGMSYQTVRTHTASLYRQLQVHGRIQAVRLAVDAGWVEL